MADFKLTPKTITEDRLGLRAFRRIVGSNSSVFVFELSDFPHWDELLQSGTLDDARHGERVTAIHAAIAATGEIAPGRHMNFLDAMADEQVASVNPVEHSLRDSQKARTGFFIDLVGIGSTQIWGALQKKYLTIANDPVFIGAIGEWMPPRRLYKKVANFVLRQQHKPEDFWSLFTGIPRSQLTRFPTENLHNLSTDLHEARHTKQIGADYVVASFYHELDSDLFAYVSLRKAGVGAETNKATMHGRYLQMLSNSKEAQYRSDSYPTDFPNNSEYWFQPAMDALLEGKTPPSYFQIHDAVMEIRCRLAMCAQERENDQAQPQPPSDWMQNVIKSWIGRPRESENPVTTAGTEAQSNAIGELDDYYAAITDPSEDPQFMSRLLPDLRKLSDDGAFTNDLSRHIAGKILEAGEYFSEGITDYQNRPQGPAPAQGHRPRGTE